MQISPIKNILHFNNKKTYFQKQQFSYINQSLKDTVCFKGKGKTAQEKLKTLDSDIFPSLKLRNYMILASQKDSETNLLDVHMEYYSKLFECNSLDEAKEFYPEFKDVIDAIEIDEKTFGTKGFKKIQEGKLKGINKSDFSLVVLKLIFGQAISLTDIAEKEYFNLKDKKRVATILSALNINIDKRYTMLLQSEKNKKVWQNSDYKEKLTQKRRDVWQDEQYRKKMSAIQKINQNNPKTKEKREQKLRIIRQTPEFKEKISQALLEHWQNPEYREKLSKIRKEISSAPEVRNAMSIRSKELKKDQRQQKIAKIVYYASSRAWEMHPFAKEIYRQTAKEVSGFSKIMAKIKSGTELDDGEKYALKKYFSLCRDKAPELKKEIGQLQKEILASWGFYDKDRDLDKIIETYLPK